MLLYDRNIIGASSEIFGNLRKSPKNVQKRSPCLRNNFGKSSKIFGKSSKTSSLVCLCNKQNITCPLPKGRKSSNLTTILMTRTRLLNFRKDMFRQLPSVKSFNVASIASSFSSFLSSPRILSSFSLTLPAMFKAWRTLSSSAKLFERFSRGELDSDESELLLTDIVRFKEERMVSIYKKCRLSEK